MVGTIVADKSGDELELWTQTQSIYLVAIEILSFSLLFIGHSLLAKRNDNKIKRRSSSTNDFSDITSLDKKNGLPEASSFCYDDPKCEPSTWAGKCEIGKEQSPIDIEIPSQLVLGVIQKRHSFKFNKMYRTQTIHHYYAQNNGHTVQFELTPDTQVLMSDLEIWGGGLGDSYKFAQLHFHWGNSNEDGSEHTLNGHKFPMELHVVHYRKKYGNLKEAMDSMHDRGAIAVMAIFFQVTPYDNVAMRPIVKSVSQLMFPGNVTGFMMNLNIGALYPGHGQAQFARYYGSLTTPSCDEIVVWTVFMDAVPISQEQIYTFRQLRNSEMSDFNYRPLQALYGREVKYYKPSFFNFQL